MKLPIVIQEEEVQSKPAEEELSRTEKKQPSQDSNDDLRSYSEHTSELGGRQFCTIASSDNVIKLR